MKIQCYFSYHTKNSLRISNFENELSLSLSLCSLSHLLLMLLLAYQHVAAVSFECCQLFFVAMQFLFTHFFRTSICCLHLSLYFHLLRHFGPSPAHFFASHPPHSFYVLFINILNCLFSMQLHCASC